MTSQTGKADAAPIEEQGSHHYIVTLELSGRVASTVEGTVTPPDGWTRADVYRDLYADITAQMPELRGAHVAFFALEPNQL